MLNHAYISRELKTEIEDEMAIAQFNRFNHTSQIRKFHAVKVSDSLAQT
jgi:hypothetical protein